MGGDDVNNPSGTYTYSTHAVFQTPGNPANPMEPRDPGVNFCIDGHILPPSPEGEAGTTSEAESAWRQQRSAHDRDVAAALRSAPPPSDDSDEEDHPTS